MKSLNYLFVSFGVALALPVSGFSNPYYGSMPTGQFPPMAQPFAVPSYAPYRQQAYPLRSYRAYPGYSTVPNYNSQAFPAQAMQYRQSPYGYPSYQRQPFPQQSYKQQPYQRQPARQMNYKTPNYQFSNMTPFGNSFSPTNMFNNNNFPSPWKNSGQWNPWKNGNNANMPFFPSQNNNNKKKAWGTERNIWPDFYTDFTEEFWDQGSNAPYDMGRMPGGWRAPSLSSPDPVTVGDAVLNQFPPMMEEMGNMMDFSN